jgi:ubiquinone/menaquinone biosynthesis C-methylase UbiE
MKHKSKTPKTDWDNVAGWYDDLVGESGSEYHRQVVLPGTIRLLDVRVGQSVIDIACGQGVLCRMLAKKGAEVTGVDASAKLIDAARSRGLASIHYHVADATRLEFLPAQSFDSASCILALQNIQPIQEVFAQIAHLLKSSGRVVIVLMHPAFRGAKATSWGWDDANKVQYRRVDRYLIPRKSPIITRPGVDPGIYTWTFHKPLEAYVKAIARSGLLIDALEEWPSHKTSTSGPRAHAENIARKEIPMFMAIRAVKIARDSS